MRPQWLKNPCSWQRHRGPVAAAACAGPVPATLGRYQHPRTRSARAPWVSSTAARDPMINREVALKAIPLAAEFEGRRTRGCARQVLPRGGNGRAASSHPHIVTIYDAGRGRRHRLHRHGAAARHAPRRVHDPRSGCCRWPWSIEIVGAPRRRVALCAPEPGRPPRHQAGQRHVRPARAESSRSPTSASPA